MSVEQRSLLILTEKQSRRSAGNGGSPSSVSSGPCCGPMISEMTATSTSL